MTETNLSPNQQFCEAARAVTQNTRHHNSALVTGIATTLPILLAGALAATVVSPASGPLLPVVGYVAATATIAAATAGVVAIHEGVHNAINRHENRTAALPDEGMSCRQTFSRQAIRGLEATQGDDGKTHYEGSNLSKILRAYPAVLDEILATPFHSDPLNMKLPLEEKKLRGFIVDNPPKLVLP